MENKKQLYALKKEWVKVINSYSDYKDKHKWSSELKELDDKIKELETS